MKKPITVLLADDDLYILESLRGLLKCMPEVDVIGEACDGEEAVALALQHKPDVVLMDISMPRMDGYEAARQIRLEAPEVRVIMLTAHADYSYVERSFQAGAAGFLVKTTAAIELRAALEEATAGSRFINSVAVRRESG
jgi:DNA-binding NarL/FixJ family response regulator